MFQATLKYGIQAYSKKKNIHKLNELNSNAKCAIQPIGTINEPTNISRSIFTSSKANWRKIMQSSKVIVFAGTQTDESGAM